MEVSEEEIKHRQELFCMTVKSCFLAKITKYQNLLRKHVHIDDSQELSDDEVELVLGTSHQYKPRFTCRQLGYQLGPAGLFRWVFNLIQKVKARRILTRISGIPHISVKTTILDVTREISVAYEYQLMMLYGDEELIRLAQHAVSIFMTYLNQNEARFTPASLLQALLEVKPKCSKSKEIVRTQTAIWNNESVCYKWKLGQIFKQPGLRILDTDLQNQGHETLHDLPGQASCSEEQTTPVLEEGVDEIDCAKVMPELTLCKNDTDMKSTLACEIELENVSSVILGQNSFRRDESQSKFPENLSQRRINTLDMNFEQGTLNINEYHIELNSDFSPVSPDDSESENLDFKQDDAIADNNIDHLTIPTAHNEFQPNISHTIPSSSDKEFLFTQETYHSGAIDTDIVGTENSKTSANNVKDIKSNEKLAVEESCRTDLNSHNNESSHNCAISLLTEPQYSDVVYKFYGCFTPYGARCQPLIYGFRGPLYAWDDNDMKWTLIYNDQVSIHVTHCNEIKNTNCFHQEYRPKTSFYHNPPHV